MDTFYRWLSRLGPILKLRIRLRARRVFCLLIATFYLLFLMLMAHDLWTVFNKPEEWQYVFGIEGFSWAYKARVNYIISGIAWLLWNLLGLVLALLSIGNRQTRFIAGHLILTFAYLTRTWVGLP